MIYETLREANVARQQEWDPGDHASNLDWRLNEFYGEIGEINNVLKKIHRERCGVVGSRAHKQDLADELADGVICLDLVLMTANFKPAEIRPVLYQSELSLPRAGRLLFNAAARVGTVLEYHTELGAKNSSEGVIIRLTQLAQMENIDLPRAVANKFNATSEKNSLKTRLRLNGN